MHAAQITARRRDALTQAFLDKHVRSGMAVLDLGSRTGGNLHHVANRVSNVKLVAVDYHHRIEGSVLFTCHNLEKPLPFEDAEFDIVICNDVIEHVEQKNALMHEIIRVCKKIVVTSLPNTQHFKYIEGLMRGNMGKQYKFIQEDGLDRHRWITYYLDNINFIDRHLRIIERFDIVDRPFHRAFIPILGRRLIVRNQLFFCELRAPI